MRGRQSAGMLDVIGVTDTVARDVDDYVGTAVRLVRDVPWRDAIAQRLRMVARVLFDDARPIAACDRGARALAVG